MEQFVASTCDSLILTKRHPHTALSIILQVEKDDGAVSMLVHTRVQLVHLWVGKI